MDIGLYSRSFWNKPATKNAGRAKGKIVSTSGRQLLKQLFNLYSHAGIERVAGSHSTIKELTEKNYIMLAKQLSNLKL